MSVEKRKCLFCDAVAPDEITTESMIYHRRGKARWYSNALTSTVTGKTVRFYVCPECRDGTWVAWDWARKQLEEEK